jgi:tRNA A37 methylthiotransferase MiaB
VRICLVNAPTGTEFSDPFEYNNELIRRESCLPQLGILSLAAVTERQGCETTVYDCNRAFFNFADTAGETQLGQFAEEAAHQIVAAGADVFGFGSICSAYPLTVRLARFVKTLCPDTTIVFGGPQASVVAESTLKAFPFVDFVLRGEAEETLPLFLEEVIGKRRFEKVPGLAYRSVWGVQRNPDPPVIMDLDALPMPAYHLTQELRGEQSASLELGRGCPFACTFCSTNDFFRRKFRLRSPQRVLDEMRSIHAEYGITDFDLTHDMFTVDSKRVRAFCQHMIDSGTGYTWSCSARTDCVDQELIEFMAAAGCAGIFFGVETGSGRMQNIIDKHLDVGRAYEVIDIAERAGVRSTVSLITGFPEEQWDDLRDTARVYVHAARTRGSNPQLNLLAPLANTPIHLKYKDQMTLGELCSDMSHQGRRQNPEDIKLIRRYPDIFPNFYLLPTPHLDRGLLIELREFMLMARFRSRWLLAAADEAANGILDLFVDWVDYRKSVFPGAAGPELRHYYRTPRFHLDFLAFLHDHRAGRDAKVQVLVDFYERLAAAPDPDLSGLSDAASLKRGEPVTPGDIPVRTYHSRVVELSDDLEAAIDAVAQCDSYEPRQGVRFYIVSQADADSHPGFEVSQYLAAVVKLCDGHQTVAEVMKGLSEQVSVTPASARLMAYECLLEKARSEGLIAIYRIASAAADSQFGGVSMAPYNEMRAAASVQNQPSVQAE